MPSTTPKSANEFIERQLAERVEALESRFEADVIGLTGSIVDGVDDLVRKVVEEKVLTPPKRDRLVVVLTTDGGFIEVVQRIVLILRHNYNYVAFIIPNHAFSAGTVLVMSGDDIYMDYYSCLGPIDPQVETEKHRIVSAVGYLVQYERLLKKAEAGELNAVEANILLGFDQGELYQFEQASKLSVALLREWLAKYKFKDWMETETRKQPVTDKMRAERAEQIALKLSDTERWHVHGHGISMEVLRREIDLRITDFGEDPELSELVRSYHSLLEDYNIKLGNQGVLHTAGAPGTPGTYLPYLA